MTTRAKPISIVRLSSEFPNTNNPNPVQTVTTVSNTQESTTMLVDRLLRYGQIGTAIVTANAQKLRVEPLWFNTLSFACMKDHKASGNTHQ